MHSYEEHRHFAKFQFFGAVLLKISAARELARYKLDVVGVQEVRWEKEGTVRAVDYNFFYGKGSENHQLGTSFYCAP